MRRGFLFYKYKIIKIKSLAFARSLNFGRSRIRTYVGRSPTVLQTVAFDRSAILPSTNQFLLKQLGTNIITKIEHAVIFPRAYGKNVYPGTIQESGKLLK